MEEMMKGQGFDETGAGARGSGTLIREHCHDGKRGSRRADQEPPSAGALVRNLAPRMSAYAEDLRGLTYWPAASDLTRRQPALVFGMTALAGFFALRTKAAVAPPALSKISATPSRAYRQ